MAVTDGVFDEGTFDNATFNNVTRGEAVDLADSSTPSSEFLRSFSDDVFVNDSDIKNIDKKISESLSTSDFSFIDTSLFRSFQEQVSITDSVFKSPRKGFNEQVSLSDSVSQESELFRILTENVGLSEERALRLERSLSEQVSPSDSVGALKLVFRSLQEGLPLNDSVQTKADLFRAVSDSLSLSDLEKFSLLRIINESPSVSDSVETSSDLFRALSDNLTVTDSGVVTEVTHGYFQTPSSNTSITETVGFEPDVVEFRVTSTNTSFNTSQTGYTDDFGWGHGFAKFNDDGTVEQYALSDGSGSQSTNGHYSESTDSHGVFQVVTDNSGDNLQGKIRGTVTGRTSTEFTVDFVETNEQQIVTYSAYKFPEGNFEVGFFEAENTNTTQSITEPGFKPNFLRLFTSPNLESMNSTVNLLSNGSGDHGWGHGVAVENSDGVKQGSLAVSQWSSNIDGHAYTSSGSEVLSIAFMTSKQNLNGTTKASALFTSNGFDLTYNTTSDPDSQTPVVIYMAAETESTPDAGFETTPVDSTGKVNYSTNFELDNMAFFSSNTIPSFGSESGVGRQTWSWNFGQVNYATSVGQNQLGFYSSSNSVNGHAYSVGDTDSYRQIYTDQNGGSNAGYRGEVTSLDSSKFTIDWKEVVTSTEASNNSYIEAATEAFAWYGFKAGGSGGDVGVKFKLDKSVSESLGFNDTVVSQSDLFRRLIDYVNLTDSDVKDVGRILTETVLMDDSVVSSSQLFESLSENVGVSDSVFRSLLKNIQENIALNDSVDKSILIAFSENVNTVDDVNSSSELFRSLSESVGLNDSVEALIIFRVVLSETLDLSDSIDSEAGLKALLSESVSVSDDVSSEADLFRQVSDSLGLSDETSKRLFKRVFEDLDLSDDNVRFLLATVLSESVSLGDDIDFTAEFFRNLVEYLVLDDSDIKELGRRYTQVLDVDDSFSRKRNGFRSLAEQIVLSDDSEKKMFKVLVETIEFIEDVNSSSNLFRSFDDFVTVSDDLVKTPLKGLSETVRLSEFASDSTTYLRSFDEIVSISDSVLADITLASRTLSESVSLDDTLASSATFERVLGENVDVNDFVFKSRELFRTFNEAINVSGTVVKDIRLSLNESVVLNDVFEYLKAAQAVATTVEIKTLQKASTELGAFRKAVAELGKHNLAEIDFEAEKKSEADMDSESVSEPDIDKF